MIYRLPLITPTDTLLSSEKRELMVKKIALIALAFVVFAPISARAEMLVSDVKVMLGIGQRPAIAHGVISNQSASDVKLVGVSSPAFKRIEMHTHQMSYGVMKMRKVPAFDIQAGSLIMMKSGGLHLMLFEPRFEVAKNKALGPIALTFRFDDDTSKTIDVTPSMRSKKHAGHH